MIRLCGAALGFFAFSVTIILGLVAGNTIEATLFRAIGAMFVFCVIGLATGWVANRVLDEHAQAKHREMFPDVIEGPAASPEPSANPAAQ